MISDSVIISFYTVLVGIITIPIMVAVLMKIKTKVKFSPFLLGILSYFTFAVVCVAFVNIIFINNGRPTASFINSNVVIYSFYFAIVTGLLEELGIYVAFKKIIPGQDHKLTPFMYSLGHAGLDAFLISGPAMIVYIICATAINELGIDGFKTQWADTQNLNLDEIIDVLTGMGITDVLLMGLERIMYFVMHIFLSIMIFYSAQRQVKQYFWIAVILRGLCTIPGSLKNYGTFSGSGAETAVLLVYTIVIIAAAGYVAIRLYKNLGSEQILYPRQLFGRKPENYL